jgi:hypothetical protein
MVVIIIDGRDFRTQSRRTGQAGWMSLRPSGYKPSGNRIGGSSVVMYGRHCSNLDDRASCYVITFTPSTGIDVRLQG